MADKIDQLKFGSTSYDIDLPPDATPSIASLTAGTITAQSGTVMATLDEDSLTFIDSQVVGYVAIHRNNIVISSGALGSTTLTYPTGADGTFATQEWAGTNCASASSYPNDAGEIKTKNRIALKGYTGDGNPNPTWYYKLVRLPADNNGNYASAIINGRIGGWVSENMSSIYCLVWNRNGIGCANLDIGGTGTMSSIFGTTDIVVYKNSDNTADVYLKCKGYFTFDLDIEVFQSTASITYDGTYVSTTPSGTLGTSASTTTSRLQLENGVLKVGGTALYPVSGVNNGTNWTSITINGVTKNIPSGGSSSLTLDNVSDGTTRKLNKVTAATGKAQLGVATVGVKPNQTGQGYLELSDSSVAHGTTTYYRDSINYGGKTINLPTSAGTLALTSNIKHLYKHWVIFNVYSDISFKFEFYSTSTTSSSTLTAANLLQMLQGKIVGAVNNNSGSSVMLSVHQAIQANTYQGFIYYVGGSYVEFYPFAVNVTYVTIEDSGYEEV